MDVDNQETTRGRSTVHPRYAAPSAAVARRPDLRHAMVVVNRVLRSTERKDDILQDRIRRAACILKAAEPTETAFLAGRPVDVAFRIAARIVKRLI